jgi:hypothetical protein
VFQKIALTQGDFAMQDPMHRRPDNYTVNFDWYVKSILNFFAFRLLVTQLIMRVVLLIVPIVTIGWTVEGSNPDQVPGRIFAGLLLSMPMLVVWRIACEVALILFTIAERLGEIAAALKK